MKKVILISIDGMRPDGLRLTRHEYLKKLEGMAAYTYNGRSVFPSVTLPCHFSMTHSVTPQRHGILTNTYVPQVRPVEGIIEKIKASGARAAMFLGWEPLRDIAKPGALKYSIYFNSYLAESVDTYLTDEAIKLIDKEKPEFAFLYMVDTDEKGGHDNGWMSDEYIRRISIAIDNTKRIVEKYSNEYSIIIMADHGGHDRVHGTDSPEDMTIPFFFIGDEFKAGEIEGDVSLLDIAPTIAKIMGILPDPDWEGKSIF